MRQGSILGMAVAALVALSATVGAEALDDDLGEEMVEVGDVWEIRGSLLQKNYIFEHDALQRRADEDAGSELKVSDDWRDGSTDGTGWGFELRAGRGSGKAVFTYMRSDYTYELIRPRGQGYHRIDTKRTDLSMLWQETTRVTELAQWGWQAGVRYIGTDKAIEINEYNKDRGQWDGEGSWHLFTAGYHGSLRPFNGRVIKAYGDINLLFGEASGLARTSNDTEWDGQVDDLYADEFSLGYGLSFRGGVGVNVYRGITLAADYSREWLYSFKAVDTESSVVMFPDNHDAMFTENHYAVTLRLDADF